MSTNITGVIITQPLVDPDIGVGEQFYMGGQIVTSGGGGWAESGDMHFQWDQGIAAWVDIAGAGDLYTEDTNPILGLQTVDEQVITVINDGDAGTFQIRVKLVEDDLTEHFSDTVDVTVAGAETFYQNTGQGIISPVGSLSKKTSKGMGGHSVPITGSLATAALFTQDAGGHAMTITGTLSTIVTFAKAVGDHAMTIIGTLSKKTSKSMGGGQVDISGTLSKKTSKTVGGGSVAPIGTLATATMFAQAVGGASMSIIGSLATQFIAGGAKRGVALLLKLVGR